MNSIAGLIREYDAVRNGVAISQAIRRLAAQEFGLRQVAEAWAREEAARQEALRNAIENLAPGPIVTVLFSDESTREERNSAAQRLALDMPMGFKSPAVRRTLEAMRRDGANVRRWLQEEVFVQALLLAAENRHIPRKIRLGPNWLRCRGGTVVPFSPTDALPVTELWQWLRQEAMRQAANIILEHDRDVSQSDLRQHLDVIVDHTDSLVMSLSARERELLALLGQGASDAEVAARMAVAGSTVRVMRGRIRRKLARSL